ncbi:MAG: cofC [Nocardioides sp.]|jgi:2-phospho-L-lactate guanylyltransferase|uniref:2-phospho-L-lactate guanylyltransferase n=1 Tax=Nocardioides sp. TaxID=35761 RepID=UPI00262EE0FA|nr:2-phospho-L-lactate guanylyltransferase [Nocardioides sp.]MCW2834092.1 cofC [Nocardioides sp.]
MPLMPADVSFVVIVPVKPPARGKSRLDTFSPADRRDLATAFARDTVAAAQRTPYVDAVLVVTDDHRFASVLSTDGCEVIPDGVSNDLNATLRQAAAECVRRWPSAVPVALCADLPCLVSDDLAAALAQAQGPSFVRDADGTGTTLYAAPYGEFDPSFGDSSADLHLLRGADEIAVPAPSLRLDVDDPADLAEALLLGVGPHTAQAWARTEHLT